MYNQQRIEQISFETFPNNRSKYIHSPLIRYPFLNFKKSSGFSELHDNQLQTQYLQFKLKILKKSL